MTGQPLRQSPGNIHDILSLPLFCLHVFLPHRPDDGVQCRRHRICFIENL